MNKQILIVEDEHALAAALAALCRRLGAEATLCYSGRRALEELENGKFALAVLDIGLPDMSGLKLLEEIRRRDDAPPVLIITAHGNLDNAVAAKKLGSTGYLVKPLDLQEVRETIDQLLGARPSAPAGGSQPLPLLIGAAPAMQRTFVEIAHACAGEAPVLITGQTGTGKTLAARVIHANSARRDAPFVTLHCGSLPEPLLESELFGYEKNAFTGALSTRPGHIERATGGTLFLDEIADIPAAIQAKLLRFVEERTFTRIGGREDRSVDLRLITATNRNLLEEVRAGRFREDLYYRLHVLEIGLSPLSQRKEDIPALAAVFLGTIAPDRRLQFSPEALALLCRHPWPGNVRQLRNTLEHAVAVSSGDTIFPRHLPGEIREPVVESSRVASDLETALENWLDGKLRLGSDYDQIHGEIESVIIKSLLKRFDNKPTVLARSLNMNRVTLRKKMGASAP